MAEMTLSYSPTRQSLFCRFKGLVFLLALVSLAYLISEFTINNEWNLKSYLAVISLIGVSLAVAGISSKTAAYAAIAFLPTSHILVPAGGFSITLPEIYLIIFLIIKLASPIKIRKTLPVVLIGGLYLSCLLSLVGSPYIFSVAGLLLRFTLIIVFFVLCLNDSRPEVLLRALFFALLTTPLTAIAVYIGEGVFFESVVYGILNSYRAVYSSHYPIWFAFLIPISIYFRVNRIFITLAFVLAAFFVVTSYARATVIGFSIVFILFLLFYRNEKNNVGFKKLLLFPVLLVVLYYTILVMNYLSFTTDSDSYGAASSEVRFMLVQDALKMFFNNPILGNGFGAESATTIADVVSETKRPSVQVTILQAMVELGIVGTCFYVLLAWQAFLINIRVLKNRFISDEIKFSMLITFAGFITFSLNSTGLAVLLQYAFLLYIYLLNVIATKR